MQMRCRLKLSRVHSVVLFCSILLICFPESIAAAVVTLDSIEIYKTHELFKFEPTVYFRCKGENHTILPDVKEKNVVYTFKGEESWQPLTDLTDKKCKRCGIYEQDSIKSDDVFEEWEFCASDFTRSDGKYVRVKEKEFNVTFLCLECVPLENTASEHSSGALNREKGMHWALMGLICAVVSVVIILAAMAAYKYVQKRKKQQEQARFLKLFEDVDEIEDELGIGPLSHVI